MKRSENKSVVAVKVNSAKEVEVLLKKRLHSKMLYSAWRKRMEAAQRKVRKYRTTRRQMDQMIRASVQTQRAAPAA